MKNRILRFILACEIYAHEVDAYLARIGGNYDLAAESILRKMRCKRELDLLKI